MGKITGTLAAMRNSSSFLRIIPLAAAIAFSVAADARRQQEDDTPVDVNEYYKNEIVTEHGYLDIAHVAFSEVLYDFLQHKNLSAIRKLEIAKANGFFDHSAEASDLLLGRIYTDFGMTRAADELFASVMSRDILTKTRNEAWFHKASLQYRIGNMAEAKKILQQPLNLSPEQDVERRIMLANLFMAEENFVEAQKLLGDIPLNSRIAVYAWYNLGVAHIRAGNLDEGIKVLATLANLPPQTDEEIAALKDRAALAMGLTYLQQKKYDKARSSFLGIRLDGPFTNQALLGMGYANFERQNYKNALKLWLKLIERNPADPAVQEALMLAPRAYEELNAQSQALTGYRIAANIYRSQLKNIEKTIARVRSEEWLDSLMANSDVSAYQSDPLADIDNYMPGDTPESAYLYHLFASHEFVEPYKQYYQLVKLQQLLDYWNRQIPIFSETLHLHKQKIARQLPTLDRTIDGYKARYQALKNRYVKIHARVEKNLEEEGFIATATPRQLDLYERIESVGSRLAKLPKNGKYKPYHERFRRVKGLLFWDMAFNAPKQRTLVEADTQQLADKLAEIDIKINMIEQTRKDLESRASVSLDNRLAQKQQTLNQLKSEVARNIHQYKVRLQNKALKVLAESRKNLGLQLADAHLAIARMQDKSVSEAIDKRKTQ